METIKSKYSIHAAIEQQDVDFLRRLVDAGCDVEQKEGYVTPLLKAVLKDNLEMVDILLSAGADVNTLCYIHHHGRFMSTSLKNVLSSALMRFVTQMYVRLTPVRHEIIKRLIDAGSDLDVPQQFQHIYGSPLQIACRARLWPVIVDLIEAGSKVDIKGPQGTMALVTAASVADRGGEGDHDVGTMTCPPWGTALTLLVTKSPTLRLNTSMGSLFKQVIEGSSARVLCMLLKADKPAYGIEEAVDALNSTKLNAITKITSQHGIGVDGIVMRFAHWFRPLEISIACLLCDIHRPVYTAKSNLCGIRQQFAMLRLLRDARANVCHLDDIFKQFLLLIRNRLNTHYNHLQQDTLEYCNQILHAIEADLDKPRTLLEMCRTRVRYELNIRGLGVHHIRNCMSHIHEKYLLYGDLLESDEYSLTVNFII